LALPLQIGISLIFVVCCYGTALFRRNRSQLAAFGISGIGSLALLLAGMFILREAGADDPAAIVGYVGAAGFIWLLAGLVLHLGVLQFCGFLPILFAYGWLMHAALGRTDWGTLQLSWLPLAFLFIWIGSLLHHRSRSIALVLLMVGVMLWLTPEVHGLITAETGAASIMELSLVGKLIVGAGTLFAFRKKWIEWVVQP